MPHSAPVRSAAFSPDGRTIVTGDYEGAVRFWDTATGQPIGPTLSHTKGVRIETVAYSPDGRIVITGSDDTTGRLWDAATGQAHRRTAQASGLIPERQLPARRQDRRDRRLGQGGPFLGHGHRQAGRLPADAPESHLGRGVQSRRQIRARWAARTRRHGSGTRPPASRSAPPSHTRAASLPSPFAPTAAPH